MIKRPRRLNPMLRRANHTGARQKCPIRASTDSLAESPTISAGRPLHWPTACARILARARAAFTPVDLDERSGARRCAGGSALPPILAAPAPKHTSVPSIMRRSTRRASSTGDHCRELLASSAGQSPCDPSAKANFGIVLQPGLLHQQRVELRLERTDRDELAVAGLRTRRRSGAPPSEQVGIARVTPNAGRYASRRSSLISEAAPSVIAASITWPFAWTFLCLQQGRAHAPAPDRARRRQSRRRG
jgi:hypothetical protein